MDPDLLVDRQVQFLASQVKVGMVCKVCDGVLVAGHVVIDAECIVICQGVADTDIGIARVVLVAVRAKEGKGDLRSFLCFGNLCIPRSGYARRSGPL